MDVVYSICCVRCSAPWPNKRASRSCASAALTSYWDAGGSGASSAHSGRCFHTASAVLGGGGRAGSNVSPKAANIKGVHPQPLPRRPITDAMGSGSALAFSTSFCKSCKRARAISNRAKGKSSAGPGASSPSAVHRPRGVGTQNFAGCTKANNSSTSKVWNCSSSSRDFVKGAWQTSAAWFCSNALACSSERVCSSPSALNICALPAATHTEATDGRAIGAALSGRGWGCMVFIINPSPPFGQALRIKDQQERIEAQAVLPQERCAGYSAFLPLFRQ